MTIQSGFFNSINGDRKYDARWFAQYFASFIGNGVFPNPSNGLQIVESENMNIVVKSGKGWINGYFVVNDSDYVLTLDNADGVLKRIDRVVMRLNYLTRQIEIDVKKGIFASNPVAPTLQRDTEFYELGLADILINNGAVQITQANITDTRLNNDVCGVVHGVVDQVDTTNIFNQYQSWIEQQKDIYETELTTWTTGQKLSFEQWMAQRQSDWEDWRNVQQADFEDWFVSIQGVLDGDVAGNLLNLINDVRTDLTELQQQFTTHLDNDAFIKHKANQISVVNPETEENEDLQTFAEELFTSVSNGKDLIGTAITDVDGSLVVPTNPTFQNLAYLIRNISTGKKWASGVGSQGANVSVVGVGTNSSMTLATVTGLGFKASSIIIIPNNNTSGYYPIIFKEEGAVTYAGTKYQYFAGNQSNGIWAYNLADNPSLFVDNDGFNLARNNQGSGGFVWYAYE